MLTYTAIAPAKINLQLRVFPKHRDERFHTVENTMQTLTLHDKLTFSIPESKSDFKQIENVRNRKINDYYGIKDARALTHENDGLTVCILIDDHTGQNLCIPPKDNLITKALFASRKSNKKMHIEVLLEKNIPAQAGLGGGSSDAAATLEMTKKLFNLEDKKIARIATDLGSDVPYFLKGGKAKMIGTGATLAENLTSLKNPVVLVKPKIGVDTKACYEKFDEIKGAFPPKGDFNLANDLQKPASALVPEIADALKLLEENSVPENVLMTGSGSCCYAICETFDQARKIATLGNKHGFWARACSCANIKASLID